MKKFVPILLVIFVAVLNFGCFPNIPAVSEDGKLIAVSLSTEAAYYSDHWEFGRDPKAKHETLLYTRDLFVFNIDGSKVWRVTDFDGHIS
ncbi:MAG: hypothetical protein K8S87_03285 [Planctomycetes bacterium]|nr:hypothetical protein [Planctomycetota bacterium]